MYNEKQGVLSCTPFFVSISLFYDAIVCIFEVDGLLCRLSFLSSADAPCNVECFSHRHYPIYNSRYLIKSLCVSIEKCILVLNKSPFEDLGCPFKGFGCKSKGFECVSKAFELRNVRGLQGNV